MSNIRIVDANDIYSKLAPKTFAYVDENVCPLCHYSSNELTAKGYYSFQNDFIYFYVLKACPNCGRLSLFKASVKKKNIRYAKLNCCDLTSHRFTTDVLSNNTTQFSDIINNLSPRFVSIFNQSELSEQNGYDEICGMGYRKSLEFLIKDYLCKTQPENTNSIKNELLSNSINRISDERIKILAQRCAWLGNDETHYIRKHEEYDVGTLKLFISAVVHFVETELVFLDALEIQQK